MGTTELDKSSLHVCGDNLGGLKFSFAATKGGRYLSFLRVFIIRVESYPKVCQILDVFIPPNLEEMRAIFKITSLSDPVLKFCSDLPSNPKDCT